jgi:hypothetical protein
MAAAPRTRLRPPVQRYYKYLTQIGLSLTTERGGRRETDAHPV